MRAGRRYTEEELYRLICAAKIHPDGGYNGESFWRSAIKEHGQRYFKGRSAPGLRQKWRTLVHEMGQYPGSVANACLAVVDKEAAEEQKSEQSHKETNYPEAAAEAKEVQQSEPEPEVAQVAEAVPQSPSVPTTVDVGVEAMLDDGCLRPDGDSAKCVDVVMVSAAGKDTMSDFCGSLENSKTADPIRLQGANPIRKILAEMSATYALTLSDLLTMLHRVGGKVEDLQRCLSGESVSVWTELEDIAIRQPEDSEVYKYVLGFKGSNEVRERKKYLGIMS